VKLQKFRVQTWLGVCLVAWQRDQQACNLWFLLLSPPCRIENGKMFEEVFLDKVIAEEREWRSKTDIDVQMGIARDEKTQLVLATR